MNHTPAVAPPRWAVVAAYAVPLCVLPSALWRLSVVDEGGWYPVFLSALSMVLAVLTVGLVHRWGERVPPRMVAALAITGGSVLVALCAYFLINQAFGLVERGWSPGGHTGPAHPPPGWDVLRWYVPLLAWGPLVLAVAADFRRRHRGRT